MFDLKWVGVLATIFLGFTIIMNVMSGTGFVTTQDRNILDQQKMTQSVDVGLLSFAIPGSGYINGLIHMTDFNEYNNNLFTGNAQIIYFALTGITFVIMCGLFLSLLGVAVNAFRPR